MIGNFVMLKVRNSDTFLQFFLILRFELTFIHVGERNPVSGAFREVLLRSSEEWSVMLRQMDDFIIGVDSREIT